MESSPENSAESEELVDTELSNTPLKSKVSKKKPHPRRVKLIKHPNTKKGLYRITSDGNYYYKVDESKKSYGLSVKAGALVLNYLENKETGINFKEVYTQSEIPSVYVEYYWSFFKNRKVPNILKNPE